MLVLILLSTDVVSSVSHMHTFENKDYEILQMLVKETFQKPNKDRTQKEKTAIARFWRAKGSFKVRHGKLFSDEKEVSLTLVKLRGI